MATKTSVLGLTKPDYSDVADIGVLNTNFDLIDSAVEELRNSSSARNLLDNSNFSWDAVINHYGMNNSNNYIAAWSYFIDRWKNFTSKQGTWTISNEGIKHNFDMIQVLPETIANNTVVTFAAKYTDGTLLIKSATVTRSSSAQWHGSDTANNNSIFIVDAGDNTTAYVRITGAGNKTLQWAALYEGTYTADTLPAYQYKGKALELLECMRYVQSHYIGFTSATYSYLNIAVPMRITPTATVQLSSDSLDPITVETLYPDCVYARYDGGTAGWSDAWILLSAEY